MVYYKLQQVLQSAINLLQFATGITKCDDYYKLRQYNQLLRNQFIQIKNWLKSWQIKNVLQSNSELQFLTGYTAIINTRRLIDRF